MSALTPRKITEERFRFNLSTQDALDLLAAAYRIEVEARHREFIIDDNTERNLISLAEYITQPTPKFGVLCCGTCGNGKTTLLYAFQRVVNKLQDERHFRFMDSVNIPFVASMDVFKAKEIAQISKDQKRFRELMQRPMLAVDDLGTEPLEVFDYNNVNTPLIDLIDYRYSRQLFTFITTNLLAQSKNKDEMTIRKRYKDRIADRFNEMFHVIVFKDISYRRL